MQTVAALIVVGGPASARGQDSAGEARAKTLEDAQRILGDLPTVLVPIFQAEAIPGTTAYMCGMNKKPWIQKGDSIQNPFTYSGFRW